MPENLRFNRRISNDGFDPGRRHLNRSHANRRRMNRNRNPRKPNSIQALLRLVSSEKKSRFTILQDIVGSAHELINKSATPPTELTNPLSGEGGNRGFAR